MLTESSVPIVEIADGNVILKISVEGNELVQVIPWYVATGEPKTRLFKSKVITETLVAVVLK